MFSNEFFGLLTGRPGARNIGADVAADSERLLAELRAVPLPDPTVHEDEIAA